jgi:hypothetical protein
VELYFTRARKRPWQTVCGRCGSIGALPKSDSNAYTYCDTNSDAKASSNAKAAPDATAPPDPAAALGPLTLCHLRAVIRCSV